jgi:outer membrane protein assembly factor BamB
MNRFLLILPPLLVIASSAPAADWPQFRGPLGMATSVEKDLPVHWSATENLRWKIDLPGRGLSNPVIADGRVYVTASGGWQQDRLHVLCFAAATGKKLWERQLAATGGTQSHPKTCMAAPTPCTDGKQVYALFATGDLACLDSDGNLRWYRSLVGDYPTITNQVGMAASPVVWKDTLIVPMENVGESFLTGIDTRTGKNRWKVPRKRDIHWTTPLVVPDGDGADVLFLDGDELAAFDVASGEKRWSFKAGGLSTVPSPVAGREGTILVPAGEITAVLPVRDKPAPELVWKSNKLKIGTYASPLYYQDRVYVCTSIGITCGSALDGKELYKQRIKGALSASPVAGDGKVYVLNEDGVVTVLESSDEAKVLATNTVATGEIFLATPAIADGAIYLRSDQHLYCIGKPRTER